MDREIADNGIIPFDFLLPKKLETNEEGKKILTVLKSHLRPVQQWNTFIVSHFPASQANINALISARRTGRLVRGFEDAEKKLASEKKGISNADLKTGLDRKERISRLAVFANDGSERFYRQIKKLVEQNWPRVLAIHLDVTSRELGGRLFGKDKRALFLLISHRDEVIHFLTSLVKKP